MLKMTAEVMHDCYNTIPQTVVDAIKSRDVSDENSIDSDWELFAKIRIDKYAAMVNFDLTHEEKEFQSQLDQLKKQEKEKEKEKKKKSNKNKKKEPLLLFGLDLNSLPSSVYGVLLIGFLYLLFHIGFTFYKGLGDDGKRKKR